MGGVLGQGHALLAALQGRFGRAALGGVDADGAGDPGQALTDIVRHQPEDPPGERVEAPHPGLLVDHHQGELASSPPAQPGTQTRSSSPGCRSAMTAAQRLEDPGATEADAN